MAIFSDNPALRNHWYVVATELEVAEKCVARALLGQRIVIYRDTNGLPVAAPDRCPHREAPLSAGAMENGVLTCCYHGWRFGAGGKCIAIPSADAAFPIPQTAHLPCIKSVARYGLIWVCLGDTPAQLPNISQENDPAFRRINNPVEEWKTSALRMTDNFLDIAHFPWVHTGTFGNRQRTQIAEIELEMLEDDFFGYRYGVTAENPPSAHLITGQASGTVNRKMDTGFHLPFTVRSTILYETGMRHVILMLPTPLDDLTSYFTFVVWRNDDFRVSAADVIAFDRSISAEDKVMLERIPGVLPLAPRGVTSTHSDKASAAWRHQFARLLGMSLEEPRSISQAV